MDEESNQDWMDSRGTEIIRCNPPTISAASESLLPLLRTTFESLFRPSLMASIPRKVREYGTSLDDTMTCSSLALFSFYAVPVASPIG